MCQICVELPKCQSLRNHLLAYSDTLTILNLRAILLVPNHSKTQLHLQNLKTNAACAESE